MPIFSHDATYLEVASEQILCQKYDCAAEQAAYDVAKKCLNVRTPCGKLNGYGENIARVMVSMRNLFSVRYLVLTKGLLNRVRCVQRK